jgi:hypothetical protein
VALSDRLSRLEGEYGLEVCEKRYCMWAPIFVEVIHYPDGTEERLGEGPPPLCESCSYREGGGPGGRIRMVEVMKRY